MFNRNLKGQKTLLAEVFITLGIVGIMFIIPSSAYAFGGDIAPASAIQVHDMQMLNEQMFMHEQANDLNNLEEGKARYWKKNKSSKEKAKELTQEIQQQIQQKQQQVAAPSKRSEFVEENGQLRIKYY